MDLFPIARIAESNAILLKFFLTIQYQYRFINIAIAIAVCLCAMFFAMEALEPKSENSIINMIIRMKEKVI